MMFQKFEIISMIANALLGLLSKFLRNFFSVIVSELLIFLWLLNKNLGQCQKKCRFNCTVLSIDSLYAQS